ncbi:MAG: fibronectin type III domain-containing protein, partial [Bacteroidota bacterium]
TIIKTVNPLPTASITAGGALTFCSPGSVTLTANAVAGTTYQWRKNGANISGATLQTYAATTSGTYTVVKTITATTCSAISNSLVVTAQTALTTTVTEPGFNSCGASTVLMEVVNGVGYTYQWFEDSHALPNTNYYQYGTGHNGNYSCTITNLCGSWPSSTYILNSPWLSQFSYGTIVSSGNTTICNSQAVTLSEYFGWQTYSGYQWFRNGTGIAGATTYFYNATLSGDYVLLLTDYCWQTGTYYNYYTNWITVTNNGGTVPAPAITAGGGTTLCPGGNVVLTEQTGAGWTYQWLKNSVTISGATNPTYSANSTGNFQCRVSNVCGNYNSNTIAVTVQPNAVTIAIIGTGNICSGSSAPLSSTTAGLSGSYQWKLNGAIIAGATQSSYFATATGSYTCSIANSCGTFTSNSIAVTVSASCTTGLQFDGTNDFVRIPNNSAYSFGTGNYTIEMWVRAASIQTGSQNILISNRTSGTNGFTFFIFNNFLTYSSNSGTINFSKDLRDNVCHHVCITRVSGSLSLYIDGIFIAGSSAASADVTTTGLVAIGSMPATGSYFKGNIMEVRLWNIARTIAQIQSAMNLPLAGNETGLKGYWKFNDGTGQVANDYSTINNDGQLGSTTSVDVSDPTFSAMCPLGSAVNCLVPTNLTTTNITNTSAQVNWSGATADSFMVRYAVHSTTNFAWKKITGQPNITSTSITGLTPGTQYDWWVRSLCTSMASSSYQISPAMFTTGTNAVPCIVPYNLGAGSIGNTSAVISWTNYVSADTFRIRYSVNTTTNFMWKDVNGSGAHNTTLTGLSPNTTYQFQVSSKCAGVTSAYSTSFVFTTLNIPVPCITPYGLSTTNILNHSAKVNWTNQVSADTFRVRYAINGTTNYMWKDVNGAGGITNTTLTGLNATSTYKWQVSTICTGHSSGYSSVIIFSTPALRTDEINGIENIFSDVVVYPNPAHTKATVEFTAAENTCSTILLTDLAGRRIRLMQFNAVTGTNAIEIDVEGLMRGIYLVEIRHDDSATARVKLVVE